MKGLRALGLGIGICLAGLAGSSATAFGEGSTPGEGAGGSSSLAGSLVTPGSPAQGEQAQAAEEAKLANPNAVAEREASRTKFENLSSEQATALASEVFPAVIKESAGGPPKLSAGESIAGYPADNAAQVDLPEGKHGVVESSAPIAVETSPGQRTPVDLSLSEVGGAFEPKMPSVGVRISKRLSEGVKMPGAGVSLMPVDEHGVALNGSEGAVDGASVFYANTEMDTDTVAKPTTGGFEIDSVLRSIDSPQRLYFRVGMPAGAQLVQEGSGDVKVVDEGATLAQVLAPVAHDAQGTSVGSSMAVSGDELVLSVADGSGEHAWPIVVDPTVHEYKLGNETESGKIFHTEWHFEHYGSGFSAPYQPEGKSWTETISGSHAGNEWGGLFYTTRGASQIIKAEVQGSWNDTNSHIQNYMQLGTDGSDGEGRDGEGHEESYSVLAVDSETEHGGGLGTVCAPELHCSETTTAGEAKNNNTTSYYQESTGAGGGTGGSNTLTEAFVEISQEKGPELSFNTTSEKLSDGQPNVLYEKSPSWLGPNSGAFEVHAKDPGTGLKKYEASDGSGWFTLEEYYNEGECYGVQCPEQLNQGYLYKSSMVDGEDSFEASAEDAVGLNGHSPSEKIKVDGTPPYNLGLTGLPSSGVINEAQYHLQGQATDGKAPVPSAGVKSLVLKLDGYVLPGKAGNCTPGPCTVTGEWTIDGETFGAGKHTLTLEATDYAGNVEKKEYSITVRHASSVSVGPGSVDPITGALHLSANDVSLSGGRGSLGVSRSYDSRRLTAGEYGPLGPQWSLNISGSQTIEKEPSGGVVLITSNGGLTTFESNGKGGYVSPKGDENLVLEAELEGEKVKAYLLKDPAAGTTVKYIQPGSMGPWVLASSEGALTKTSGEKETVEWERIENITRPKLALAPASAGVTCSPELKVGCRALKFTYAYTTTATGEAPSQWKAYKGRLEKISLTAYNPSTKAMETKSVAEYSYDAQGRLRAEWDPRISPALVTTYGYDAEGHVTSINPPGGEPSLFHYGTTASDSSAGRLLSVTRPPAGTATQVKEQDEKSAPEDTAVPTLSSTSPVIGTTLSIASNGSWNNSPLVYSDSWEDCYTYESKETCTAIPGAVNSTYTPQAHDAGYTLRAQVTAVNADGAIVASSSASSALTGPAPAYLSKWGESGEAQGQLKSPASAAVDASGNVWVVDSSNSRVQEFSASGTFIKAFGWDVGGKAEFQVCTSSCKAGTVGSGAGQFSKPAGIAINQSTGDVYVVDKGNNRIEEFSSSGAYLAKCGESGSAPGQLSSPTGIAIAPVTGYVWVSDTLNDRVDEFSEVGAYLGSFGVKGSENGQLNSPEGIAFSGGNAYVVDSANDRVQEFSMSGQYIAKFGAKGTGNGQFETPGGIATEPVSGDLYVADSGNSRIEEFNPAGTFLLTYGKKGESGGEFSSPQTVAFNPACNVTPACDVYIADTSNNRVQELKPTYVINNPAPEPPTLGNSAVTTIDYNVPVSGTGAPHEMTKAKLEEWGQVNDLPTEATAVFPPDEPMGWPAKEYKRATITYLDELGRTVNVATPTGGISTSEYNEDNEVIRSLSADNRAAALKEGSKSKEVSEQRDTKSKYNGETKEEKEEEEKYGPEGVPGTRLLETTGPQHTIRLAGTTTEKQARNHVEYEYASHGTGSETVYLVSRTRDSAEYEGKESEVRKTTTSYSGQENLGWLLRKPTSVTASPAGATGALNLVHSTVYEPGTGNVIETQEPGSKGPPPWTLKFGSSGKGNGQFTNQNGVAVADENVYVVDESDDRVEEFSSTGEYITQWGSAGSGNGQFRQPEGIAVAPNGNVYVVDTVNERVQEFSATGEYIAKWGSSGTENGQFSEPTGVAVAPNGNVYVTDRYQDRVQEFSPTGEYITKWGSRGTENGQFIDLSGIAVASNGDVYVTDSGNDRVEEFSAEGKYLGQWGSKGSGNGQFSEPEGVTVAPNGDVYVTDVGNARVEEFSSGGVYITKWGSKGTGNGEFEHPRGIALTTNGEVYVGDSTSDRVQEFSFAARDVDLKQWGSEGSGNGQFKSPKGVAVAPDGDVYVASNDRVQEFSSTGEYITKWGSKGSGNGQFDEPGGVAVAPNGDVYVADSENDRVEEFSPAGVYITKWGSEGKENGQFNYPLGIAVAPNGNVYVVDDENDRVQEFSPTGEYITNWGSKGTGNGQFEGPKGIAVATHGDIYVTDGSTSDRVQEFSSAGEYITQWGSKGKGEGQFEAPDGIAVATGGEVYVVDKNNDRVQEFSASGQYLSKFGVEGTGTGQLKGPTYVAVAGDGSAYVADSGNDRVQEWGPGDTDARDSQTIYYTAAANATTPACGLHPEWANLPCQSQPAAQPSGPELPIVTDTYNIWDEPETVTEKFEWTTRTKKMTYDSAGRLLTNEETASPATDTALPKVTDKYSAETGVMVEQSTTSGETTKKIKGVYNTLGQLTEYTDANGNTTQYVYSGPVNDSQVEEVNYGDKKGSQMYSYNATTKQLEKLLDVGPEGGAGAGTFTAGYDVEGKMTSETYPNSMTAKYTFNPAGETTGLEYEKTAHCAGTCPEVWFKETVVPSIHGEALLRTSTLAKEEYTYDEIGRLTQVNETPVGKGCKTRIYGYDEESERTSETTRESATETCATSGGTTETHTYDTASRLNDTGVEYETFGNQTKIPAADAGEHEITASFYVDNQIAMQKQNGETTNYTYDPSGRTEKTVSEGGTKATVVNHYPGPGEAISWTEEEEGKDWTRNIPGIDGSLAATQHNSEAAILQLHDLQGNIVATAAVSEIGTKLLSTYNSTEFGVPVNGTPPTKFSWLGAGGLSTEQSSGAANPGGGSYIPQLGAPLQTQPVAAPGAFGNGVSGGGIVLATYTTGGLLKSVAVEHEAALDAAAKQEAEEIAGLTARPISETEVDGPGEGNCEPGQCEYGGEEGEAPEGGGGGGGTFVEEGAASIASGPHCGTFVYAVHGTRGVGHGSYRTTVSFSANFYPGYIPAYWKLTLFVDGQFYTKSGGGGTVDIETFSVTVNTAVTVTVPKRFPLSFVFVAETVEGGVCQVARDHPDVEVS